MFKVYKVYFKKGLERHEQTRLHWFEAEESVVVCSPAKYIPSPLSPSCWSCLLIPGSCVQLRTHALWGRYHFQPAVYWSLRQAVAFCLSLFLLITRYWNCQCCCVKIAAATLHVRLDPPRALRAVLLLMLFLRFWFGQNGHVKSTFKDRKLKFLTQEVSVKCFNVAGNSYVPLCHTGTLALVSQRVVPYKSCLTCIVKLRDLWHGAVKQEVVVTQPTLPTWNLCKCVTMDPWLTVVTQWQNQSALSVIYHSTAVAEVPCCSLTQVNVSSLQTRFSLT